jgi:hypothetical protein
VTNRTMEQIMGSLGDDLLDEIDAITREAHSTYRGYDSAVLIDHDLRAQASCTYSHMVARADRRFLGRSNVRPIEKNGLKVWLFEEPSVVIRFKKMDEDGRSRNYQTKQAKDFDAQRELPFLPSKPVRLTAGYLLDRTGTEFVRAQIARPDGREVMWCGAVVPHEERKPAQRIWTDVTRQGRFGDD